MHSGSIQTETIIEVMIKIYYFHFIQIQSIFDQIDDEFFLSNSKFN